MVGWKFLRISSSWGGNKGGIFEPVDIGGGGGRYVFCTCLLSDSFVIFKSPSERENRILLTYKALWKERSFEFLLWANCVLWAE